MRCGRASRASRTYRKARVYSAADSPLLDVQRSTFTVAHQPRVIMDIAAPQTSLQRYRSSCSHGSHPSALRMTVGSAPALTRSSSSSASLRRLHSTHPPTNGSGTAGSGLAATTGATGSAAAGSAAPSAGLSDSTTPGTAGTVSTVDVEVCGFKGFCSSAFCERKARSSREPRT